MGAHMPDACLRTSGGLPWRLLPSLPAQINNIAEMARPAIIKIRREGAASPTAAGPGLQADENAFALRHGGLKGSGCDQRGEHGGTASCAITVNPTRLHPVRSKRTQVTRW